MPGEDTPNQCIYIPSPPSPVHHPLICTPKDACPQISMPQPSIVHFMVAPIYIPHEGTFVAPKGIRVMRLTSVNAHQTSIELRPTLVLKLLVCAWGPRSLFVCQTDWPEDHRRTELTSVGPQPKSVGPHEPCSGDSKARDVPNGCAFPPRQGTSWSHRVTMGEIRQIAVGSASVSPHLVYLQGGWLTDGARGTGRY